ncbi:3-ketosteroid reductase [Xylariales sp. PMI_506]|nr:3-ketosteroid reductase [Xylariales sp. PMI_506]
MVPAPWNIVSSHEQVFIMVTGANSGIGLGILQRLIDDFLVTRSLSSHLILIPTTRTTKKSSETIRTLRAYLSTTVNSKKLSSCLNSSRSRQQALERVHILSIQLDLCDIPSVYAAAEKVTKGEVTDPTGIVAGGRPLSIPRLDALILNAGVGGWTALDWLGLVVQVLRVGPAQAFTWPTFKIADKNNTLPPQNVQSDKPQPLMAKVFTSNVFGHYILAHELLPLMSRPSSSEQIPLGRVIWGSSPDSEDCYLDMDDFQAIHSLYPYESSKRITDLISLSVNLPGVRRVSSTYFSHPAVSSQSRRPLFYVNHPGIVATPIFPLPAAIFFLFYWAMFFCRYLGSPWHTAVPYVAACASVWLALASQDELDAANAQHIKWGSACDSRPVDACKPTEVDGWGWEGKIEDPETLMETEKGKGILSKLKGRKWDAKWLTEEDRIKFEEKSRDTWRELEALRMQWEEILGQGQFAVR